MPARFLLNLTESIVSENKKFLPFLRFRFNGLPPFLCCRYFFRIFRLLWLLLSTLFHLVSFFTVILFSSKVVKSKHYANYCFIT
jgi:hypothetical protein